MHDHFNSTNGRNNYTDLVHYGVKGTSVPLCLMLSLPDNVLLLLIAAGTHTRSRPFAFYSEQWIRFTRNALSSSCSFLSKLSSGNMVTGYFEVLFLCKLAEVFLGHSRKSGIRDSLVSLGNKANKFWSSYKSSYYLVLAPDGGLLSQLPLAVSLGKQLSLLWSLVSHYRHHGRVLCARQKTRVSVFLVSKYLAGNVINLPVSQQWMWWISVARRYEGMAWSSGPTRSRANTTLSAWAPTATWPCRRPHPVTKCSSSFASSWFTACCVCHPSAPYPTSQIRPRVPRIRVRRGLTSAWSLRRTRAKEIRAMLAPTSSSMMVGIRWHPLSGLHFVERACHVQFCPLETIWLCDWWPGELNHVWILLGTSPRSGWVRHLLNGGYDQLPLVLKGTMKWKNLTYCLRWLVVH